MSWYRDYDDFYPRSQPRQARGGIKAQSRRGGFGQSWWARRWIEVLESFDIGARLGRGRSYARGGQVLAIDIQKGLIKASVQGSQRKPYQIQIKVRTLTAKEWDKIVQALSRQALFAAQLLAGRMPENIEEVFLAAKLSLFPRKQADLATDCSCPDWSNPCKHIAAVYYLLGEEFDRDPFLIFKLRGMEREELLRRLGTEPAPTGRKGRKMAVTASTPKQETETMMPPEPLPLTPEVFWSKTVADQDQTGEVSIPSLAAALPKRLGNFPFWRAQENFISALEEIYRQASPTGMVVFLGERKLKSGA
jgi:uncharacterized Zn finger protein